MIDKLNESFHFREQALALREERQRVLAANIANADTPGYKARDIDFSSRLADALDGARTNTSSLSLERTSRAHISGGAEFGFADHNLLYRVPEQPSLDGNTVDMERERAHFTDNSVRYMASLTLMSGYIRGLREAMQPE